VSRGGKLLAVGLATTTVSVLLAQEAGAAGPPRHIRSAKVRTDGTLTVGGQETLTVRRVPAARHERLRAFIFPPPTAELCNTEAPIEFGFFNPCIQEPLNPVPGTRNLKRSKKGRASLTFVMPPAYEYIDLHDPLQSHPIYLVDNQTVEVVIMLTSRPEPQSVESGPVAASSVVVDVPPLLPSS
jgi:hypothetical protein